MGLIRRLVDEPGADSPVEYARRVGALAVLYPLVTLGALAGELLLGLRVRLLVTLAQRSNVETLTLAFFAVFFAYVGVLAGRGAPGALRVLAWRALARLHGREATERARHRALRPACGEGPFVALNVVLERPGRPGAPFSLPVEDAAGRIGHLEVDGACVRDRPERQDGSTNLLAFFARQVSSLAPAPGGRGVDVVAWGTLDDDQTRAYLAQVDFARNLGAALGHEGLWPRVVLDDAQVAELGRRIAAICPALREEAQLPHWEYEAEHKLPIVPEPLGLASLGRTERRADPLPALAALTWAVFTALGILVAVTVAPPWVPGK
ncbi:MAG: hypothetical protein QM704_04705 [Anaeromyxobacteraceae bacterium]